jgi:hypothetical protein
VGVAGSGTLNITGAAADITVSNLLRFGPDSTFSAASGATIHMTGSAFENVSTNEAALAGLEGLTLVFEGGWADVNPFEVAGEDMGNTHEGFQNNFRLSRLVLGGADVGKVQLVDLFNNGNRGGAAEALYVVTLEVDGISTLHLNGLNLYTAYFRGEAPGEYTAGLNGVEFGGGSLFILDVAEGDTDCDGDVDGVDLAKLGLNWNPTGSAVNLWETGDFDRDGDVDAVDLASLGLNWNPTGIGPVTQTPEPATVCLMTVGLAGVVAARKRRKLQK